MAVYPNPVVFQTVAPLATAVAGRGSYLAYRPAAGAALAAPAAPAHTYETLVAGADGIEGVRQPLALQPTFADASAVGVRRTDVERLVQRMFPSVRLLDFRAETRWDVCSHEGLRRVLRLRLAPEGPGIPAARLRLAMFRFLQDKLPGAFQLELLIEEKCHESATHEPVVARSKLRRAVRQRGAGGTVRRTARRTRRRTAR